MGIGITEEHQALAESVRRFAQDKIPAAETKQVLEEESPGLPAFWKELGAQGWLGLHVPEEHGGAGYSLVELAIVLEELGRAVAPGPFLPTVLVSAVLSRAASPAVAQHYLPQLSSGALTGALGLAGQAVTAAPDGDAIRLSGTVRPVLGGDSADLLVLAVETPDGERWVVVEAAEVTVRPLAALDGTRRLAEVELADAVVPAERLLDGMDRERVESLTAILVTAESSGVAAWCLDTAASYAKVREQFGRPIGQFQAVKHRAADMLLGSQQTSAAAWDAARAADEGEGGVLVAAVAAALGLDAAVRCAKDCVQILGGIGFTWEHDAHMYLRRALTMRQLLGGGRPWRERAARLAIAGVRRRLDVDLPAGADDVRDEVRRFLEEISELEPLEQRSRIVEQGYLQPHWPKPWGREATPVEQLVIDEEFKRARIRRPHLMIGGWVLPTLISYGSAEQQERWIAPTMLGEISWCQMFSEPGAGSDLAAISTKAVRVDGGWQLSGQKVWTSMAQDADFAICLARTNADVPKHEGITYFIVDMKAAGLDVRPLRELTGMAMFNEVFLNDVFVPDDHVIGEVDDGWKISRTTLANERIAMSSGSSFGGGVETVLKTLDRQALDADEVLEEVGELVAEAQSLSLLAARSVLRALEGVDPGPESSVRKLIGVEHEQRASELNLALLGPEGAVASGDAGNASLAFLANRCLTIAGGTSEVQRNVIGERILGLPRDPEPTG
jgi:3-oxochol-4-en-24-oyl-CoA dehydrogenase